MDNQGGNRKGQSAIDLACKKVCTYELIRLLHLLAANVDIDALACFDMMVEACQNLSFLSHGADPRYIQLHGQTHRQARYHPKHAFRTSPLFNQHSDVHPWYGAGQGTGDAAVRWTILSHALITAYQSKATSWQIKSVLRDMLLVLGLDDFVDDTNMIHGAHGTATFSELLEVVQRNLDLWQGLLRASGGALNAKKCSWTPFIWTFNKHGHARLSPIPDPSPFNIYTQDMHGVTYPLKINKPDEAIRLLGIHIAADGSYAKELSILQQKQDRYVQFLLRTPLSHREARVIYKQCYLPTVTYPFPATNMPPAKIYDTQCTVTSLFLTRMGYPRHIPRCVVYAPEMVGGIGLRHLGHEQGVQQTLHLI